MELAHDLDIPYGEIRYRSAGINHMAFYLKFEHRQPDGSYRDLYPDLRPRLSRGPGAQAEHWNPRCPNKVRYEMLTRLGYFVTESSEHFAEYTPYFIKEGREDLIEKFGIPLDEYPKRCVEQIARWKNEAEELPQGQHHRGQGEQGIRLRDRQLGVDRRALGDLRQRPQQRLHHLAARQAAPSKCRASSIAPASSRPISATLPPQLTALIRTNINVQELTVAALMTENREHIYHAAMMDPHTAAELDLDQIWNLVDDLLAAHGDWLPRMGEPQGRSAPRSQRRDPAVSPCPHTRTRPTMTAPFKVAIIGAGSVGFTKTLISDLLKVPEFAGCRVRADRSSTSTTST